MSTKFEDLLGKMRNRQLICASEARGLEEQARNLRIEESALRQWSDELADNIKESVPKGTPCPTSS